MEKVTSAARQPPNWGERLGGYQPLGIEPASWIEVRAFVADRLSASGLTEAPALCG